VGRGFFLIYAFSKERANGKWPAGQRFLFRQLWKKRTPAANQSSCYYGRPQKMAKTKPLPSHDFREAPMAIAASTGGCAVPIIGSGSIATVDREIWSKSTSRINLNKKKS